jgi:2-Cys peroxiredoxin 5
MAFRLTPRLTPRLLRNPTLTRTFTSTRPAFIQIGDRVPNLSVLVENSPANKVNLSELTKGKALIIGVPAAFSMIFFSLIPERETNGN